MAEVAEPALLALAFAIESRVAVRRAGVGLVRPARSPWKSRSRLRPVAPPSVPAAPLSASAVAPSPFVSAPDGLPAGWRVRVAGLVLVRQRPGSARGAIFATLEDETGVANVIVRPPVFERYRRIVLGARLLEAEGRVEREGIVVHVLAKHLVDRSDLLEQLVETGVPSPPLEPPGRCRQAPDVRPPHRAAGRAQLPLSPPSSSARSFPGLRMSLAKRRLQYLARCRPRRLVDDENLIGEPPCDLDFAAPTIAAIYKERWKIELFFKALNRRLARPARPAERHAPRPGGGARRTWAWPRPIA